MKKTIGLLCVITTVSLSPCMASEPVVDHSSDKIVVTNSLLVHEVPNDISIVEIKARLKEIQRMDKSGLTVAERRDLRQETKALRKRARHLGYFIAGGLICTIVVIAFIFA